MTTIEMSKYYSFNLISPWSDKSFEVFVIGTTDYQSLESFNSVTDVKKEYFDDYNLGIANFVEKIDDETIFYLALPIKTKSPNIENEDSVIAIPKAFIKNSSIAELLECEVLDINISGITRNFNGALSRYEYIENLKQVYIDQVDNVSETLYETSAINVVTSGYTLMDESVYNEKEEIRLKELSRVEEAKLSFERTKELENMNIYNTRRELKSRIQSAEYVEQQYNTAINDLTSQQDDLNLYKTNLDEIKSVMIEMLNQMRLIDSEVPDFYTLYSEVESGNT